MNTITIFTDGASKGNPGPGGWGALVATDEHVIELGGREDHTTNNRMEMTAALRALVHAATLPSARDAHVTVHTDSSYVINGITKWVHGWKKREWMTAEKKDVLNRDLWQELDDATHALGKITWTYVGGHVGIAGNERVDEIASDFALGKLVVLYDGPRTPYSHAIHSLERNETLVRAKSSTRDRSKQKAHSYVSVVDGDVRIHKTWSECEARVRGKHSRFKKALSAEDEATIVRSFSQ